MKNSKRLYMGIVAAMGLIGLASCTPGDIEYCRGFGVEGTPEFGKCMDYYHQQQSAFKADYALCSIDADGTYPPSLYDYGHDEHIVGGYGPYGWHGGTTVHVSPDYQHNAQVDALRMRIIQPCMQARGWNSGSSWQAGRHAVNPVKKAATQKLPWQ